MDIEQESKNALGHVIGRFTIIDFLGYLVPGTLVTLALNEYFDGKLRTPIINFFGNQPVMLAVYFIILSYLIGTIIHEASKPLDQLFAGCLKKKLLKRDRDGLTPQYYRQILGESDECQAVQEEVTDRYRKIYHRIEAQLENSKVPLFRAFSTFSRTGACSVGIIAALYWTDSDHLYMDVSMPIVVQFIFVAALFLLLLYRNYRFRKIIIDYVYDIFDNSCSLAYVQSHAEIP